MRDDNTLHILIAWHFRLRRDRKLRKRNDSSGVIRSNIALVTVVASIMRPCVHLSRLFIHHASCNDDSAEMVLFIPKYPFGIDIGKEGKISSS